MAKKQSTSRFAQLAAFFFTRWRLSLLLWAFMLAFGATVYTNVIKREGFPPIQFPVTFVAGQFDSVDKNVVDAELAQPFYETVKDVEGVDSVQTTALPQQFQAVIFFESDVDPIQGTQDVNLAIAQTDRIADQVKSGLIVSTIDPGSYLNKYDLLLSVYSTDRVTETELEAVAGSVAEDIASEELITLAEVVPLQRTIPGTDRTVITGFNHIGLPNDSDRLEFSQAVTVGIDRDKEEIDVIELSELVQKRISELDMAQYGGSYQVTIGADFAESINTQISSLQTNLFTGLLAVALVSLLLITWRASIITALFMITVMAVTVAVLYIVGYTLNTITLFALVLALGLFVDDATIVVESIDAHRDKKKKSLQIVKEAIAKIGAASFAGTATTVLVFLPMAFLSGVLGEFIRLMPVTVIIALISSLLLSLTLIPVLSRFILLQHRQKSWLTRVNPVSKIVDKLAHVAGNVPRALNSRTKKAKLTAGFMVLLTFAGVFVGFGYASQVEFNIFPKSKDSDSVGYNITFPPGYTIEQADEVSSDIDEVVAEELGPLARRVTYGSYSITQPNNRSAEALIDLVPFTERDRKSPEVVETLQREINESVPEGVEVKVLQYDAGPPSTDFPLTIQIIEEDEAQARALATDVKDYIDGAEITRPNGSTATITSAKVEETPAVSRVDGQRQVQVLAGFSDSDTSALLVAAEEYVKEKYTPEYLAQNGYGEQALGFDFGQESENADSFASLAFAFPIALLTMFLLLSAQFRSFLQPLLIFMAIPFTFLGVFAGLYYTDNALSFFVQVGLIGLIGIAVNNTILLTTYANQERDGGEGAINAIANAVTKRFRPLVATTLTTVVALLPLALTDPFWEPLAYTIIFGLISSTFFVLIGFPYYYLASEWLRSKVSRKNRKKRKK